MQPNSLRRREKSRRSVRASTRVGSLGDSVGSCGFAVCVGRQDPLIDERYQDEHDCETDERADAVEPTETPEVVEEEFEDSYDQQPHAGVPRSGVVDGKTDCEKRKGEQSPGE